MNEKCKQLFIVLFFFSFYTSGFSSRYFLYTFGLFFFFFRWIVFPCNRWGELVVLARWYLFSYIPSAVSSFAIKLGGVLLREK